MNNQDTSIIGRMAEFYRQLFNYKLYKVLQIQGKLKTEKQYLEMLGLREVLVQKCGVFSPIIGQLTNKYTVSQIFEGKERTIDMWQLGLFDTVNNDTIDALAICVDYTNRALGILDDAIAKGVRDPLTGEYIVTVSGTQDKFSLANTFDLLKYHPIVINASKDLFNNGHYSQAIFEAFKAVENFVQEKSGSTSYGKNLMATVFSEQNPIIQVPEAGSFDKDVQEGFKFLFMGASQGIRNPKAHKPVAQNDPFITLEYLALASLLLKRIDYPKQKLDRYNHDH